MYLSIDGFEERRNKTRDECLAERDSEKGMDIRMAVSMTEVLLVREGDSNIACVVK